MAEAVAGLLASGFVGIAKGKLGSAIGGQASLLCNFSKDLEDMKDKLELISAVLKDAEKRSVREERVQLCLKRIKDVALDITEMLEDYEDTSDQANTKMAVVSCIPVAYKKIAVANRMKSFREKLTKVAADFAAFDFKMDSSTSNDQSYDQRETVSTLPEIQVVGRHVEKQEIINMLSVSTSTNVETVIVAIWGLGGMGKSTLAQLVYNDTKFKKYDYRVWVYVSQDFNLIKVGNSMISQLPTQEGQQSFHTQQAIKQYLDKLLQDNKTVLVILDDLWQENDIELEKLKGMLHFKGSKVDVIVTTRKEDIARKVSTSGRLYELQSLEDGKCWQIIKRCSKFEQKANQEKMEEVGLDIAKKCGGVALAAQAVGFLLQSINDVSGWTEINNSEIWDGSSEPSGVLPSLKLSYERMPLQLRICFSYCATFPKGHNITEDDLIQQWSALDFIKQSKGKEYINKLWGLSFLQVSKLPSTSQEHVVRYTMHDLVHDLARLTVGDELISFDVAPHRNTHAHKYCRYSLLRKYDHIVKLENMPSKLRVLRFLDNRKLDIRSGAFSFAKRLRILDFSECSGIMLPASIGRLKQLRCLIAPRMQNESLPKCITGLSKLQCLNINGSSKLTELPESIGNLGFLEYLSLSGCSLISKLPESFSDLKCLVHLDMSRCFLLTTLPESFGKLGSLEYLGLSGCSGIRKLAESFGDLESMVHLDMSCSGLTELPGSLGKLTKLQHLELSGCSSVEALPESLCDLTQLEYLNLSSCEHFRWLPEGIGSLVGLRHLYMSGCRRIAGLPESVMKLQSLSHLNLSNCVRLGRESLASLRGLTALQYLNISGFGGHQGSDLLDDFIASLTNLEHLDLSWNFNFVCLPESIGNLNRLHTLHLSGCHRLESLPESIGTLGLKSLLLDGCSDKLMDQASSLVNYTQILPVFKVRVDEVGGCSNFHQLDGIHVNELRICSLENVMSLEEATKANLSGKHNLSELRLAWSTKRTVEILEDKDLLEQLVPPTGLKSMHIKGYKCKSFPGWVMDISRHPANLVSIELHDMPRCSNLPPLGQLPHLEKLEFWELLGIKRIDSEFCGGKGAFRLLSSFSINSMEGLEEWNTTYSVEDGVEEFMFPVLDNLEIRFCPRLRLKPCLPTFRECSIWDSDQVVYSMEEVEKTSHHCSSSSRAIKLRLYMSDEYCQSMRLFHHFPAVRELNINGCNLRSVPQSMQHLTFLESLTLERCYSIQALPEWLGNLSALKNLVLWGGSSIESLPASIQQLTRLQRLEIWNNKELKEWCNSEENKTKLAHIDTIQYEDDSDGLSDEYEDEDVEDSNEDEDVDVQDSDKDEDADVEDSDEDDDEEDEDEEDGGRGLICNCN